MTPHHLALTDEWVAGARRWAWDGGGDPWADGAIVAPALRPVAARQPAAPIAGADAAAVLAALVDGTADAVATDHAPHTEVDKAVEFGLGGERDQRLETALGVLLAAVDAGRLPLARAIEALTTGPARVLAGRSRRNGSVGLVEGAPADLVVFDRSEALDRDLGAPRLAGQEHAAPRDVAAGSGAADDGRRTRRLRGVARLTRRQPDGCVARIVPVESSIAIQLTERAGRAHRWRGASGAGTRAGRSHSGPPVRRR